MLTFICISLFPKNGWSGLKHIYKTFTKLELEVENLIHKNKGEQNLILRSITRGAPHVHISVLRFLEAARE